MIESAVFSCQKKCNVPVRPSRKNVLRTLPLAARRGNPAGRLNSLLAERGPAALRADWGIRFVEPALPGKEARDRQAYLLPMVRICARLYSRRKRWGESPLSRQRISSWAAAELSLSARW